MTFKNNLLVGTTCPRMIQNLKDIENQLFMLYIFQNLCSQKRSKEKWQTENRHTMTKYYIL